MDVEEQRDRREESILEMLEAIEDYIYNPTRDVISGLIFLLACIVINQACYFFINVTAPLGTPAKLWCVCNKWIHKTAMYSILAHAIPIVMLTIFYGLVCTGMIRLIRAHPTPRLQQVVLFIAGIFIHRMRANRLRSLFITFCLQFLVFFVASLFISQLC